MLVLAEQRERELDGQPAGLGVKAQQRPDARGDAACQAFTRAASMASQLLVRPSLARNNRKAFSIARGCSDVDAGQQLAGVGQAGGQRAVAGLDELGDEVAGDDARRRRRQRLRAPA